MAILFSIFPTLQDPNPSFSITKSSFFTSKPNFASKGHLILQTSLFCISIGLIPQVPVAESSAQVLPSKLLLSSIENAKSWFQFYGDGFAVRDPPEFQDIMEPEAFNAGLSLYGDKAKPKTFAARLHLRMGGATLYSARSTKIKEEDGFRTYYFYEFGRDEQHIALVAGVSGGNVVTTCILLAIIAGATAPQSKWDSDGVKLRSAAISLKIL